MYYKWCENVRTIEDSIEQIQRDLREAISKEIKNKTYNYTKLLSYLVICWCEARVLKLIHEPAVNKVIGSRTLNKPKSFNNTEINTIIQSSTLKDKWLNSLKISISKAYSVNLDSNFPNNLPFTPRVRFQAIENLISNELLTSIELRNRIAHGQWKHAFTNDLSGLSQNHTSKLRTENIVELQLNYSMFKTLAQLIHDLTSSPVTFERDFDSNYRKIEQKTIDLHNRNYTVYCQKLIDKYKRGIIRRNQNGS